MMLPNIYNQQRRLKSRRDLLYDNLHHYANLANIFISMRHELGYQLIYIPSVFHMAKGIKNSTPTLDVQIVFLKKTTPLFLFLKTFFKNPHIFIVKIIFLKNLSSNLL